MMGGTCLLSAHAVCLSHSSNSVSFIYSFFDPTCQSHPGGGDICYVMSTKFILFPSFLLSGHLLSAYYLPTTSQGPLIQKQAIAYVFKGLIG